MRLARFATAVAFAVCALAAQAVTPYGRVTDTVEAACRAYTGCDRDGDGLPEIASIGRPTDHGRHPWERRGGKRGAVLVLVEERLWDPPTAGPDLRPSLRAFVGDLAADGYDAVTVTCRLYSGKRHQDGLTLLALRDYLRRVRAGIPDLQGAILVGNFPCPFLVRQFYWFRGEGPLTLFAGTKSEVHWDRVAWTNSIAEPLVSPADIVLADLDGHWDQLYHRTPEMIAGITAAWPDDPTHSTTAYAEFSSARYEDFFFVGDGAWVDTPLPGGRRRIEYRGETDPEVAAAERSAPNVMATPSICISRINAWHAGIEPDPAVRGIHGEGLLDSAGRPQAVEFADERSVPRVTDVWRPSPSLERKLLAEYFARNHAYRQGEYRASEGPASISTEWESAVPEMKRAVPAWASAPTAGREYAGTKTTLTDFVAWMAQPATGRSVKAHSGPMVSCFALPPDLPALEAAAGPHLWYWTRDGRRLVPSLRGTGGDVTFGLLRTLHENARVSAGASVYLHTGCEIVRPANAETEPYDSPRHGLWQLGESFLMYGNGLALVGRGKVFYDEPREFWETMGKGGCVGDAWKRYYALERADAELAKVGIDRKRAYFWSVLGDFTIRVAQGPVDKRSR